MDLTPYKNCKAHTQWIFITNEESPYRPCCYFKTNIDAADIDEYHTKLSKLDIEKNCEYCINLEKQGNIYSQRKEVADTIPDNTLRITVSFDNLCNLKCTYCSPEYSTQIANEYFGESRTLYTSISQQAPKKFKFIQDVLNKNQYQEVEINILGGEPLINPVVFNFLDWLSKHPNSSNISVSILTNGTVFKQELYDYSRRFKYFSLGFSIDGTHDVFELIRANGKWPAVKENIDRYYKLRDAKFLISFQYALTWMNVMGFADWYDWLYQSYPNVNNVHMNKVKYPETQSVDVISPAGKKLVLDHVLSKLSVTSNSLFLDVQTKFKMQVSTGDDNSWLYDRVIMQFESFDRRRKTNFRKVLSEILKIMQDTKQHQPPNNQIINVLNLTDQDCDNNVN